MTISIRLEKPIEQKLRKQIKSQKGTLSAFVRDDLSTNRKAFLKQKLRAKHRH